MKITAFATVFALLVLPLTALAQVSIGPAGVYAQNFAFLGITDYALTNNAAGNLGWYATKAVGDASPNTFVATDGTGALAAGLRNYGSAANADRALGTVLGLPATGANNFLGLRIQNDSGVAASGIRVRYTGEQWTDPASAVQSLTFSYQVSAGDITSLTAGTFTNFAGLDFASPVTGNTNAALDGNAPANRTALDQTIAVSIPVGSEIMLRWTDTNDPNPLDAGLAIDDVFITLLVPTAAPASISGQVKTGNGLGIGGVTLVLTGGSLTGPLVARTNPFGYYQFDDVPAGGTYIIEISSKRYSFSPPTQVINVQDSVSDVDFISDGK